MALLVMSRKEFPLAKRYVFMLHPSNVNDVNDLNKIIFRANT
jgi:hypothetical protein